MPSNQFDANIKLIYITDPSTFFASDTIAVGQPFDVIGNVEVGKELMENVTQHKLFVRIVNRSQARLLLTGDVDQSLKAQDAPFNAELRVSFPGGWSADEGDVIEAIATYRVNTQLYDDYSTLTSLPIVVST